MTRAVHFAGNCILQNINGLNSVVPTQAESGILSLWYNTRLVPATLFCMTVGGSELIKLSLLSTGKLEFKLGNAENNYIELVSKVPVKLDNSHHSISVFFNFQRPVGDSAFCTILLDGNPLEVKTFSSHYKGTGYIPYKNARFFVGGLPHQTAISKCYNGDLAELWFSPFVNVPIGPTTRSSVRDGNVVRGAYLAGRINGPSGSRWVAGNPGIDGNRLLLPYPKTTRRNGAPDGAPIIYLHGGATEFSDNHSGEGAFQGSPLASTGFTVVNSGGFSTADSEPLFGD